MDKNIIKTFNLLKNSYSPYSKFRVACSIIMKDNTFIKGVNVENKSYGLTICAERNAMTSLISQGYNYKDIDYVIIVSDTIDKIIPCGACLQFLNEFINNNTTIITFGKNKKIIKYKFNELLPITF